MKTRQFRTTALAVATGTVLMATAACGNGDETEQPPLEPPVPATPDATGEGDDLAGDDGTDPGAGDDQTGTDDGATGSDDATGGDVPPEYDGVLAAIDLAVAEHDGAPAFEVDDGDGGIWEVHVAVGDDDIEVHVSADGTEVISSERESDLDSEDRGGLDIAGDYTLGQAVRAAIGEYGGTAPVDDVTIDDDGGAFAWEVGFADDVEVYLDIATGEVLRVEND